MSLAILRAMRRWCILVGFLAIAGCAPPLAPTPVSPPPPPLTPATLTLNTSGSATSLGDVLLNLAVLDATGKGVGGIVITLTTSTGTFDRPVVTTGITGTAQSVLNTSRNATVTATGAGLTTTTKATAYNSNQPLTVGIAANPTNPNKGDGVTFTATVTGGTAPFTYAWIFGDGASGTGQTTSHRYFSDGQKSISLTVTDADNRTGSTSSSVSVRPDPEPPPATCATEPSLCPPPSLAVLLTCTVPTAGHDLPCNVSVTFGGTPIASVNISAVSWDWGDGTTTSTAGPPSPPIAVTHPYAQAGSYTVFVTVTANLPTTPARVDTVTTSRTFVVPKAP